LRPQGCLAKGPSAGKIGIRRFTDDEGVFFSSSLEEEPRHNAPVKELMVACRKVFVFLEDSSSMVNEMKHNNK
jgi:hypothetical protein